MHKQQLTGLDVTLGEVQDVPGGGILQGQIPIAGWGDDELKPIWQSVQVLCAEFIHCDSRDRILPDLKIPEEPESLLELPVYSRILSLRQVCEICHVIIFILFHGFMVLFHPHLQTVVGFDNWSFIIDRRNVDIDNTWQTVLANFCLVSHNCEAVIFGLTAIVYVGDILPFHLEEK